MSYDLLNYRDQLDKQQTLEVKIAAKINDLLHAGGLFNAEGILKQGLLYKGQLDELKGAYFILTSVLYFKLNRYYRIHFFY